MATIARGSKGRSHLRSTASVAALLGAAGCSSADVTNLKGDLPSELPPAADAAEVERLLADQRAEIERLRLEAEALYGGLTEQQVMSALAGVPVQSLAAMRQEREALLRATLSADEQALLRAKIGDVNSTVTFQGRIVLQGDVMYRADDLLAEWSISSNRAAPNAAVAKANIHLSVAPSPVDASGNPVPGGPPRPDLIAKLDNGQVLFWRPDLDRRYFVVVPDDLPSSIFYAVMQAAYALEGAVPNDCIYRNFTVIPESAYTALHPVAKALSSVIDVDYSDAACVNRADGCANSPRLAHLLIAPGAAETRMQLGTYIGLEHDFDAPGDADTVPDLTAATARNVVLHELSHILGFGHPRYSELRPEPDPFLARVPQSSQGTLPSFMFPTADPLFAATPSAEDKRVLRQAYAGQCRYRAEYRLLGEVCGAESEALCASYGGSCEVLPSADAARVERCRWHNFRDAASCTHYSAGGWEASNASDASTVFPGEAGACIVATSALSPCLQASFARTEERLTGRCCSQFGTGDPGLFFEAFSDVETASFFCSHQKGLGEPVGGTWEFIDVAEQSDFSGVDAVTGLSVPAWVVSSGDYVQDQTLPSHMAISNERLRSGCVATRISTVDDGESGIVFNYRNARNFYVFDAIPNVRRRIRQVVDGVSTDLDVTPWSGPPSWTSITLTVCFGDGIHTFVDSQLDSRVSVADHRVNFVGTGGRFGLWNDLNQGARHAFLRSHSLVEGYALLE